MQWHDNFPSGSHFDASRVMSARYLLLHLQLLRFSTKRYDINLSSSFIGTIFTSRHTNIISFNFRSVLYRKPWILLCSFSICSASFLSFPALSRNARKNGRPSIIALRLNARPVTATPPPVLSTLWVLRMLTAFFAKHWQPVSWSSAIVAPPVDLNRMQFSDAPITIAALLAAGLRVYLLFSPQWLWRSDPFSRPSSIGQIHHALTFETAAS